MRVDLVNGPDEATTLPTGVVVFFYPGSTVRLETVGVGRPQWMNVASPLAACVPSPAKKNLRAPATPRATISFPLAAARAANGGYKILLKGMSF